MAQQVIDVGSSASDGTGDPLRDAFTKINDNFTELYDTVDNQGLTYGNIASNVSGITFNVTRYTENYLATPVLTGLGQAVGAVYVIRGNMLGGTTPLNDVYLTVTSLGNVTAGTVGTVSTNGIPIAPVLRVNGLTGNVTLTVNNIDGAASKAYVNTAIAANIASVTGSTIDLLNANIAAANAVISNHSSQITTLESNAATQAAAINSLGNNKASISYVDTSIDLALSSNAVLANVASVNANVVAANAAILLRANLSGANFTGNITAANVTSINHLYTQFLDVDTKYVPGSFADRGGSFTGNSATSYGIYLQNQNSQGSGDYLVFPDIGSGDENFVAFGIASSDFNNPRYPQQLPNDSFVYAVGGNLYLEAETHAVRLITANVVRMEVQQSGTIKVLSNVTFADGTVQYTAFGGNVDVSVINANVSAANAAIVSLQSNATAQSLNIDALYANAGSQAASLSILTSNASTQAISINGLTSDISTLIANAAAQSVAISSVQSNIVAANLVIDGLSSNAGVQALELNNLQSNTQSQQSAITALQSNVDVQAVAIDLLNSNIVAANTNILTLSSNAVAQAVQIASVNANVVAANVNITNLFSNAASQALDINNLYANVNFYLSNVASSAANIAAANAQIIIIDANLGSINTNVSTLQSNAVVQAVAIDLLNSNIAAANVDINNKADLNGAIFNGNVQAEYILANANVKISSTVEVGNTSIVDYPGLGGIFVGNTNSYYQVVVQNTNSGPNASGDFVITADDGDDSNGYLNIGINSSGWSGNFTVPAGDTNLPEYPHDGYITTIGGNTALRSSESIFLVANTAFAILGKDSNFVLGNIDLQFKDGTIQQSAITDIPGLYANIAALSQFQSNVVGNASYTPNNAANFNSTITNIQQALDELAARLRALGG